MKHWIIVCLFGLFANGVASAATDDFYRRLSVSDPENYEPGFDFTFINPDGMRAALLEYVFGSEIDLAGAMFLSSIHVDNDEEVAEFEDVIESLLTINGSLSLGLLSALEPVLEPLLGTSRRVRAIESMHSLHYMTQHGLAYSTVAAVKARLAEIITENGGTPQGSLAP
jgi:hypothetical protein